MDIAAGFQKAVDGFFSFLPNLLGFLVILIVGFIIAKIVQKIITKVCQKIGIDKKLQESQVGTMVDRVLPGASPSRGIAKLVFWLIFIFFLVAAVGALQIPAVTTFMNQVLAYLPNVIVAILIFVVAAIIAGAVGGAIVKTMGDTPTGKVAGSVIPALIMVIAMFMILTQLKIAENIVMIAFAATMFALALGLALAFGLGGRPVAERLLEGAYTKGQEQKEQVKADMQQGRDRAKSEAQHQKDRMGGGGQSSGGQSQPTGDYSGATTSSEYPQR